MKKKKKVSSATSTESKPDRHKSANLPSAFKDLFSLAYHISSAGSLIVAKVYCKFICGNRELINFNSLEKKCSLDKY